MTEYVGSCISAKAEDIWAMVDNATQITYRTFLKHVPDIREWSKSLPVPLSQDWSVGFFKSKYKGKPCYYMNHSSVEHIWVVT